MEEVLAKAIGAANASFAPCHVGCVRDAGDVFVITPVTDDGMPLHEPPLIYDKLSGECDWLTFPELLEGGYLDEIGGKTPVFVSDDCSELVAMNKE